MNINELADYHSISAEDIINMECSTKQLDAMLSISNKPPIRFIQLHKIPVYRKELYNTKQYRNIYRLIDLLNKAEEVGAPIGIPYEKINQEEILTKFQIEINEHHEKLSELRAAISEKQKTLSRLEHSINVTGKQLQQPLNDPLLDEDEILLLAGIRRLKCGIYFLIKDESVVYVGQSINIAQRIANHKTTKDFDTFTYIQCKPENLNTIEAMYIDRLKPKYNYNSQGRLVMPMMFTKFIDFPEAERV
jgi:molybdopterin converting factor small subunit